MHEVMEVDQDMCRICLKQGMHLRFEIDDCVEMVMEIAQISLDKFEDSNMPNKVCNACFQMLVVANDIRSRCISSKQFFDKILQSVEIKQETKVESSYADELILYEFNNEDGYLQTEETKVSEEEYDNQTEGQTEEMQVEYLDADEIDLEITEEGDKVTFLQSAAVEEDVVFDENHSPQVHVETTKASMSSRKHVKSNADKTDRAKKLRYGCCQCQFESSLKMVIKEHFNQEHSDKYSHEPAVGHVCFLCNVSFLNRADMLQHINAPRVNQFQCDSCDQIFTSEFKLQRHNDKEHPGKQLFSCEFCDKVYDKQSTLNHHKYIQHDERSVFNCTVCLKTFHRKSFFTEHMNAHLGIRNHKCSYCPAKFARRTNLQAHLRSHTGERPYKCPECPKTYSHCTDLKRHSYTHTQAWPFVCACGKGFAKKSAVESHVKQHGPEGNYYTQTVDKEDKIKSRKRL